MDVSAAKSKLGGLAAEKQERPHRACNNKAAPREEKRGMDKRPSAAVFENVKLTPLHVMRRSNFYLDDVKSIFLPRSVNGRET